MAWIKVPTEHHALFRAALPRDPRISTIQMFGSTVALVNGHIVGGVFARSVMVRLAPVDHVEALAIDGTEPFDPLGTGRAMTDTFLLGESVMDEPDELRSWLTRALTYTLTLPPKRKRMKSATGERTRRTGVTRAAPDRQAPATTATRGRAATAPGRARSARPRRTR